MTNGSKLLVGIDMRSPTARRYRDLVQAFTADIGRKLTEFEKAMVKQAASLSLTNEMKQAQLVNGGVPVDTDEMIRLSSEVRRILDAIRTRKRKSAAVSTLHDIMNQEIPPTGEVEDSS